MPLINRIITAMKQTFIGLTALLFSACAYSQDPTVQKYAKLITAEDAQKHLNIIASDAFEGRETGKPGATMAANYIAGEFKKLGLQAPVNGSYFLNVPLVENSLTVAFVLNGKTLTAGTDYVLTGAHADKTISNSDIVFVGFGTAEELGTTDIAGKVVLWINEEKPGATAPANGRMSPERNRILA